jgi:hypothetical protein
VFLLSMFCASVMYRKEKVADGATCDVTQTLPSYCLFSQYHTVSHYECTCIFTYAHQKSSHLHLVPILRISGVILLQSPHICLHGMNRDNVIVN